MFRQATGLMMAMLGMVLAVPAVAQSATACQAHGQAALEAWTQGRFEQVGKDFAPAVAAKLTPDMLRQVWGQLQAQAGSFKLLGTLAPRSLDGQDMLVAPLMFSKGALAAVIHCDTQNRLDGFRVVPASSMEPTAAAPETAIPGVVSRALPVPSPLGPLPGTLTLPEGNGPFPAVLLVAGSGPSDRDETIGPNKPFRDIAEGLAKAGIASLRYDKRTLTYRKQSAANAGFTVDDEVTDDALSALKLLGTQQQIDAKRLFVLGHSLGGAMAPRIGQRDPQLAGLILLAAPARPLLDVSAEQSRELGSRMGATKAQIAAGEQTIAAEQRLLDKADPAHPPQGSFGGVPQSYWLSLHDYHRVAVAKSLAMPMLILQGGSDFQVSPKEDYARWQQALAGRRGVSFHLYPGLSHLFTPAGKTGTPADYKIPGHVDPQVIHDIADWVKAQPAR